MRLDRLKGDEEISGGAVEFFCPLLLSPSSMADRATRLSWLRGEGRPAERRVRLDGDEGAVLVERGERKGAPPVEWRRKSKSRKKGGFGALAQVEGEEEKSKGGAVFWVLFGRGEEKQRVGGGWLEKNIGEPSLGRRLEKRKIRRWGVAGGCLKKWGKDRFRVFSFCIFLVFPK